ncbi:putative lipoprotein [Halobacteriovorax marinus SJ]|uniref:Lipoprotein n=1 Tax=Halobacteriovorax marinus (strain ATCC BAA-682 / DSM 15412 / SJ) TaxID=862908 RepID=E1X696_HALMS|nr:hypothetical protein [Halobacteriovorax marinus]CBW27441.1 putative lipoprotein [Halobacteriovorax marinus SJ]
MKWNNLKFIALIIASLMLTACVEQKSNKKSSSDTSTTQSTILLPDESGGDGDDDGYVDDTDLPDYYSIPTTSGGGVRAIIVHGRNHPDRNPPPNGIFWSSNRDINMPEENRQILVTDSRFEMRLQAIPHYDIPQNSVDSNGITCSQVAMKYTKLNIDVCVRRQGGNCLYNHYFQNVEVNKWSLVKEFDIPTNTNDPLVIEVKYVSWDGSCIENQKSGYGSGYEYTCPYDGVWDSQCVGFQMEVSTDGTKRLPGGRY